MQWDELLAAFWLWRLGFWIRLLLLCAWCTQNDKSELHKKANQQNYHVDFVQSMPTVPEKSRLLTGVLVEVLQDLDIKSPESTSQVIISLLSYKLFGFFFRLHHCYWIHLESYFVVFFHVKIVFIDLTRPIVTLFNVSWVAFSMQKYRERGKNVDAGSILAGTSWLVPLESRMKAQLSTIRQTQFGSPWIL